MNDSEFYDFEDRRYINPTLSRDEQLEFVNTLRDTVDRNTAQVNTQTQKLGTDISPNLGGLSGSNNYFKQRYQTTPVQSQVATLKATAQAKALNDLMTNYQSQAANRYQQAYRTAAISGGNNSGNTGGGGDDDDEKEGGVEYGDDNKNVSNNGESKEITPPKKEDYYANGEEQSEAIAEKTGLPKWLIDILKVF